MNSNQALSKLPTPTQTPFQMVDGSGNNAILVDSSGVNLFAGQDVSSTIYMEKRNGSGTLLTSFQLDAVGDILFRTDVLQCNSNSGSAVFGWSGITGTWTLTGGTLNKVLVGTGATASYIDGTNGIVMAGNSGNAVAIDGSAAQLKISGVAVVGARSTGWTAWTGTAAKGTFDTATATLVNVAQTVKAITDALRTHGLIGT